MMKNATEATRVFKRFFCLLVILMLNMGTSFPKTDPYPHPKTKEPLPERMSGMTGADRLAAEEAPNVWVVNWNKTLAAIEDTVARNYIAQYWEIAVQEYDVNGYRPSMKVAQAIVETGMGKSKLAKRNAHFGIKAGWNSDIATSVIVKKDDTPTDVFNTYATGEDSWRDHTLLIGLPRYKKAREAETLEQAVYVLGVSGYATSQYKHCKIVDGKKVYYGKPGATILAVIDRYNLRELDRIVGITE